MDAQKSRCVSHGIILSEILSLMNMNRYKIAESIMNNLRNVQVSYGNQTQYVHICLCKDLKNFCDVRRAGWYYLSLVGLDDSGKLEEAYVLLIMFDVLTWLMVTWAFVLCDTQ